jgi:hypothetical protein
MGLVAKTFVRALMACLKASQLDAEAVEPNTIAMARLYNSPGMKPNASVKSAWILGYLKHALTSATFLEVVGCITKVLCSLLLRTCSKDTGASRSGRTTVGGKTGPMPASQGHGDTIKQSFCDPMDSSRCNTGIRQVKPSYW